MHTYIHAYMHTHHALGLINTLVGINLLSKQSVYRTITSTGHFMLDQSNNNNKAATPTAKIKKSELSVETQYTFFDFVCL